MDREAWTAYLSEERLNPWPCPNCGQESLRVIRGTLHFREGQSTVHSEEWDPICYEGTFSCLLACMSCGETIAAIGKRLVEETDYSTVDEESPPPDHEVSLSVLAMHPSPHVIRLPDGLPDPVKSAVLASFRVFWLDHEACANHIRSAVEKFLDACQVRRTTVNTKRQRVRLALNARVDLFGKRGKRHEELATHLMALKWLGNAGSHSDRLSREDLLDGYELLEYVFDEHFAKRTSNVVRLSKAINRTRRPRSHQGPNKPT